jgi:non-specific serine/threonine protein kinase/serine/threonine-protein kinase
MVQRVALKIIKPGMDSKAVVARFEQERQALAVMDHPNVAKVFDGGVTDSGRPYFVMEYVKGDPITAFCDVHRYTIRQRLELFASVCDAVQHAHMKGIIHRDIKPSNVLVEDVDGSPVVKVIDFGIAKAITHQEWANTAYTQEGMVIGTPEYMSPEQIAGELDIDTRSDVYSLGVMLYELLTGELPFDTRELRRAGLAEIQRIIREVAPPKPSTRLMQLAGDRTTTIVRDRSATRERLSAELRRELDWIPLMALRKERDRRYSSAAALAEDVRRYLAGQALLAAPDSRTYLARKFVKRNRVEVIAGGVVIAALAMGLIVSLWQRNEALLAQQAEAEQRARADERAVAAETAEKAEKERADQLKKVSDFQSQMLGQIDIKNAGEGLITDVRERFAAALEKANVPEAERGAQSKALGDLLIRVNPTDTAAAMIDRTILKPAIKTIDDQFNDDPATDASLRQAVADLYRTIGLYTAAYPLQESALATRRRVLGEKHPSTLTSINNMGFLLQAQGKLAEAEPYFREGLEKFRRVLGAEHPDTLASINNMGDLLQAQGKLAEAEPYFRESLEKSRRVLGEEHPDTLTSINNMGFLLHAQGKFDQAEPYFREALEKYRRVLGEEHPRTLTSINNMGFLLQDQGKFDQAEPYYREALEKSRRVLGEEHPLALIYINNMGGSLHAQGMLAEAEPYWREALEKRRRVLGEEHPDTLTSINNMGGLLQAQGKLDQAEPYLREALEKSRRVLGEEHPDTQGSAINLAELLERQQKFGEAETLWKQLLAMRSKTLPPADWRIANIKSRVGGALLQQAKFVEAEPLLLSGYEGLAASPQTPRKPQDRLSKAAQRLIDLYTAWNTAEPGKGYDAKAAEWKAKLDQAQPDAAKPTSPPPP